MISVYNVKPRFQTFLHPLLTALAARGVTPNMLTIMALIGSMSTGGLVLLARTHPTWLLIMPAWLFARMALNALDGMMAREFGLATVLGAVLNEVGDVASDLALYLPLAVVEPSAALAIALFCIGAVLTEFCGVLGQALGSSRRCDGPMGKSDRALWVSVLLVVTVVLPITTGVWQWLFSGAAMLCLWTCQNRVHHIVHPSAQRNHNQNGGVHHESV